MLCRHDKNTDVLFYLDMLLGVPLVMKRADVIVQSFDTAAVFFLRPSRSRRDNWASSFSSSDWGAGYAKVDS
jgi:hypothetical protein